MRALPFGFVSLDGAERGTPRSPFPFLLKRETFVVSTL